MKPARAGIVYSAEVKFCAFRSLLEQLEPASVSWGDLNYCIDVTADDMCYKRLTIGIRDHTVKEYGGGVATIATGSLYLHDVIAAPMAAHQAMTMTRSTDALGKLVVMQVPLRNNIGIVVGSAEVTAKLNISFFSEESPYLFARQVSTFDDSAIAKLNDAKKERCGYICY